MILSRYGRENYRVSIVTDPPVTAWEASFDGGLTWDPGTAFTEGDLSGFQWLVAGDKAALGDAVAVIPKTMKPILRDADTTEIIVRSGPTIMLVQ